MKLDNSTKGSMMIVLVLAEWIFCHVGVEFKVSVSYNERVHTTNSITAVKKKMSELSDIFFCFGP